MNPVIRAGLADFADRALAEHISRQYFGGRPVLWPAGHAEHAPAPGPVLAVMFDFDKNFADPVSNDETGKVLSIPSADSLAMLQRLSGAGAVVGFNTGRRLTDFDTANPVAGYREEPVSMCDAVSTSDFVIFEWGAGVWYPKEGTHQYFGPPVDPALVDALVAAGVSDDDNHLWVGRVAIFGKVADRAIFESVLRSRGLENSYDLAENGGALALLPKGVTKERAAIAVAEHFGIPLPHWAGCGDSLVSDYPFLKAMGMVFVPANADERLQDLAHIVGDQPYGAGLQQVCDGITAALQWRQQHFGRPGLAPADPSLS
jgi:hypothetical protein